MAWFPAEGGGAVKPTNLKLVADNGYSYLHIRGADNPQYSKLTITAVSDYVSEVECIYSGGSWQRASVGTAMNLTISDFVGIEVHGDGYVMLELSE